MKKEEYELEMRFMASPEFEDYLVYYENFDEDEVEADLSDEEKDYYLVVWNKIQCNYAFQVA